MTGSSRRRDLSRNVSQSSLGTRADEDEEALIWASLEKLPTYDRLRTSIIKSFVEGSHDVEHGKNYKEVVHKEVDVRKLNANERVQFVDRLFKVAEEDNEKFLRKFRKRIDEVGIQLPTVEVRFKDLVVEANVYAGARALPTLPNAARNMMESILQMVGINITARTKLTILKGVSGIIKPARYTA